ncbi:uncharacterized protein LOC114544140 [Dendronephthya gigantea]|uniref:uncharacterized protein LOC114533591 n=1 Tax=Dendronephthya gigantea TaxID=151771 RepID=UPI00106AB807|nr:uncharacterized protein LOC114533591 [Dendronephthya gigantea]XP_028418660.1 uncharacterized protein LOC114544140 [Dendronephthya gigantea]
MPPRKIAPRPTANTPPPPLPLPPPNSPSSASQSSSPPASTNTSSPPPPTTTPPPPLSLRIDVNEPRQKLTAQTHEPASKTQVQLIQKYAKALRDKPPNSAEIYFFWLVMDRWRNRLAPPLVNGLKHHWHDLSNDDELSVAEKIFHLAITPNAITTCVHHLIGNIVRSYGGTKDGNTTRFCEDLASEIDDLHYQRYKEELLRCACENCDDVVKFDESYSSYYEGLESDDHERQPVLLKDRPMHCESTELYAQTLRTQFAGLSSSNLQRWFYFANTTPLFSVPTLAMAPPTTVLTSTLKYLEPYLRERGLQDPLPTSWSIPAADCTKGRLIRVEKSSVHLYDGDSCEISLTVDSEPELLRLATHNHGESIRVRMLNSDSPETEYSFSIYKQAENSTEMSLFLTRHVGIECMRAARSLLFAAQEVYLQVYIEEGIAVPTDHHGRRLLNIFAKGQDGKIRNFAESLASSGHTMSFYTTGVEAAIDASMREAIADKRGIFNLPDEAFTYPFRPWDIRRIGRKNDHDRVYQDKREILNAPIDPGTAWRPDEKVSAAHGGDEMTGGIPESETTDQFFLQLVPCTLFWESKCYVGKSNIPGAGRGLFLKPHKAIPKDAHLCVYAEKSTSLEDVEKSKSSRVYLITTSRKCLHFDAERERPNNLGRFANQPGVSQAFAQIKAISAKDQPEMSADNWIAIENELNEQCNAVFHVKGDQLVLRTKHRFPSSYEPTEVFVNYGSLRQYWIPLLLDDEHNKELPANMIEIAKWLVYSEDCNWSTQHRKEWSGAA